MYTRRYFIDHTIRAEQDDYEAEGVEWEHVDYFNNKVMHRCTNLAWMQRFVQQHAPLDQH